ncbi:MAG: twin transmembrane helix small protein [Alphaproteobacteria bacterium]|jgi:preprotein translocase subunit SecG|nr:twin transmembrane helix small protein [Alphaproteobacteria bacterium]MDP6567988.1 twin transmembrane helix small protein [Alphaproteobacteria bacterium]MDP6815603.1 twin transmembrane helix small protein [Alphaproteobacteria bacterium]
MAGFLTIVLLVALALVVGVLLMGIYAMGRGGEFNRKYGNRLMRWRVILQGLAVAIILMLFFANQA